MRAGRTSAATRPRSFDRELPKTGPVFWFMMQIAMFCGLATSYPVNVLLLRKGVKEKRPPSVVASRPSNPSPFDARHRFPDKPWRKGLVTAGAVVRSSSSMASMARASHDFPTIASRRTTRSSRDEPDEMSSSNEEKPAIADPVNRTGNERREPCQRGTAVHAMRTAVYPASGAPKRPARSDVPAPSGAVNLRFREKGPVRGAKSNARPLDAPKSESTQLPTLIGDVGRKTRSML